MQDLKLKDLDDLLIAYKHAASAAWLAQMQTQQHLNAARDDATQLLSGRFCHLSAGNLTLADARSLLSEHQQNLSFRLQAR